MAKTLKPKKTGTKPAKKPVRRRDQVAALCTWEKKGGTEILLITSRDTGRWVLPKGWLMRGKKPFEAARQEAWEEAGVKHAETDSQPIGSFDYMKRLDNGGMIPVRVQVFRVRVHKLADSFPEADERTRTWVSPRKGANMVMEPKLRKLLKRI